MRAPEQSQKMQNIKNIEIHPIFIKIPGEIAKWEIVK